MLFGGTLTAFIMSVMMMSDTVIAGIFIGREAVSGVNVVMPIYSVACFFATLISIGIPIIYSNHVGAFRREEADRAFGTGLTISVMTSIILFIIIHLGSEAFLRYFGSGNVILEYAKGYLRWMRYLALVMPVYYYLYEMVYADGDEIFSSVSNLISGVGNIILSVVLCRRMGTEGLGLATLISSLAAFLFLFLHFLRKRNTLRINISFSFRIFTDVIRYGMVDACTYLFMAIFTAGMNFFVVKKFGSEALVYVAVVLLLREAQIVFDGIGSAITPMIEVYFGEKTYHGVRRVWWLAGRTALIESAVVTLGVIIFAEPAVSLLGIEKGPLLDMSVWGIRIMALSLIFTCRMFLDSSYFILVRRRKLGILVCALRDLVFCLPMAVIGGYIGGVRGMFISLALSPALAYLCSYLHVCIRYGKDNYALFLAGKEKESKWFYEFSVRPDVIVSIRDRIGEELEAHGCPKSRTNRTMLMFEELFMIIFEDNPGREILAECSIELTEDKVRMITKDDGRIMDLSDPDRRVGSIRDYIVTNMTGSFTENRVHFMALSFNRNAFEIK